MGLNEVLARNAARESAAGAAEMASTKSPAAEAADMRTAEAADMRTAKAADMSAAKAADMSASQAADMSAAEADSDPATGPVVRQFEVSGSASTPSSGPALPKALRTSSALR